MHLSEQNNHEDFLRAAMKLAKQARAKGHHPFGALIVLDGNIVLSAENTVINGEDPTNHAEMNLVRKLGKNLNREQVSRAILYTSTEPCAMCSGAIYWAGVRNVVFACSVSTLAKHTTGSFVIPCRDIFSRAKHTTHVLGPFLEEEAERDHLGFWK